MSVHITSKGRQTVSSELTCSCSDNCDLQVRAALLGCGILSRIIVKVYIYEVFCVLFPKLLISGSYIEVRGVHATKFSVNLSNSVLG